ncbi:uncharacterized protein LOC116211421 [Punica granatum]|uniref:Uncharacterized protein LOC116211421 n=2 Tax=Punica granatum TaxID=22663 RepID=A0A6P8DW23_PUNGR|nr:uncharacterized protein LOC116211421 [Punica granatum]XP_031401653.1 uncharacterized protein LOC116211421 [Punica granatum]PKI42177.1 hypothetical protein CRG98_037416 [Punica granatum]
METCDISDSEQSENEKDERQTSTKASSDTHSASSSSQHASYSKTIMLRSYVRIMISTLLFLQMTMKFPRETTMSCTSGMHQSLKRVNPLLPGQLLLSRLSKVLLRTQRATNLLQVAPLMAETTAESLRSDIAMRFMPTLDFGPPSSQLVTESVRARHAITMLSSMFGQPLEELPDHFVFKQREGFISDLLGFVIILEATQERLVQLPKTVSSLLSPASMPRLMSCNLREKTLHGNSASGGFSTIFELKDQA